MAASATVSGRVPAASRAWAASAPKPTPAGAATTSCVGTAVPMAPIAPGAAKSAPRRREYLGTSGRDLLHAPSVPFLLMPHGQPFLAQLVFSNAGLLSLPRVGTHGCVMENWVVLHSWVFFMPTWLIFPHYLTLASPCVPLTACVSSTPDFFSLDSPCPTNPVLLEM